MPNADHGHPGNFLLAELEKAAAAGGTSAAEAAWNIPRTLTVATSPAWPPEPYHAASRPTLAWDVDGILAFTAEAIVAALNARFDTGYDAMSQGFFPGTFVSSALPAEEAAWLGQQLSSGEFGIYGACAPDWHAIDTMLDASAAGYPTVIITERPAVVADQTRSWLRSWTGQQPPQVVAVGRGNKPAYMGARFGPGNPAILVDDNPAVRMTIAREGIEVWTPQRPYTPAPGRPHARTFGNWPAARYWLGISPAS